MLAAILVSSSFVPGVLGQPISTLEPASTGGVTRVDRALARLSQHRRLLMIAAHPDDEDTRLLAAVARGMGGEAGYLSLTRGEGGQNLIGPELGDGLGLLRSGELEAARAIDGAQQFFSRAYDFGYTRSRDEALTRWRESDLLEDTMRVIRQFRPQVFVTVFTPDARSGHGQHQAAGFIAPRAFALANDPAAFPSLTEQGLPPWPIHALYRPVRDAGSSEQVAVSFGNIDPLTGKSVLQLALASRSQHRSQDMGTLQPLGDSSRRYERLDVADAEGQQSADVPNASTRSAEDGLFTGIDTRLRAIADVIAPGALRETVRAQLVRAEEAAIAARAALVPSALDRTVPALREITEALAQAVHALARAPGNDGNRHAFVLIEEKLSIAAEALAAAAGIAIDAWTDRSTLVSASELEVTAVVWNAGRRDLLGPIVETDSPEGITLVATEALTDDDTAARRRFRARPTHAYRLRMKVPSRARPTLPYFLEQYPTARPERERSEPAAGAATHQHHASPPPNLLASKRLPPPRADAYDWNGASRETRGQPFGQPPLSLRFRIEIDGTPVVLTREVVARSVDQALGEVRRPLRVVPRFEVRLTPDLLVWPRGTRKEAALELTVTSHADTAETVRTQLAFTDDWAVDAPSSVDLEPGETRRLPITLRAAANLEPGRFELHAGVVDAQGSSYDRAIDLIDYPHVRASTVPAHASTVIRTADIALPDAQRIAYLRGASDRVPEALHAIGLPVEVFDGEALQQTALDAFDVVVVGSRAYESDPALGALNPALLDYARGGGVVIVQYQQYAFARGGFAPYPLDIHRPHDRATDETTPVRTLVPDHRLLTVPNRIHSADWEEWVQERGLYFAGTWDDAYTPILAMADPEGVERSGALLVARVGEGWYVYTGLSFFRQLPAGVAGAYRLFANLLALGTEK